MDDDRTIQLGTKHIGRYTKQPRPDSLDAEGRAQAKHYKAMTSPQQGDIALPAAPGSKKALAAPTRPVAAERRSWNPLANLGQQVAKARKTAADRSPGGRR